MLTVCDLALLDWERADSYITEIQDQRLLEIEFLLTLVPYPRGVHLGEYPQSILMTVMISNATIT